MRIDPFMNKPKNNMVSGGTCSRSFWSLYLLSVIELPKSATFFLSTMKSITYSVRRLLWQAIQIPSPTHKHLTWAMRFKQKNQHHFFRNTTQTDQYKNHSPTSLCSERIKLSVRPTSLQLYVGNLPQQVP
jgi:hypothetical protein